MLREWLRVLPWFVLCVGWIFVILGIVWYNDPHGVWQKRKRWKRIKKWIKMFHAKQEAMEG